MRNKATQSTAIYYIFCKRSLMAPNTEWQMNPDWIIMHAYTFSNHHTAPHKYVKLHVSVKRYNELIWADIYTPTVAHDQVHPSGPCPRMYT